MLQKIKDKLTSAFCKAQSEIHLMSNDEQGDTNFISIIIVLGIVILIAGVFVGFKDQILEAASEAIENFQELFH